MSKDFDDIARDVETERAEALLVTLHRRLDQRGATASSSTWSTEGLQPAEEIPMTDRSETTGRRRTLLAVAAAVIVVCGAAAAAYVGARASDEDPGPAAPTPQTTAVAATTPAPTTTPPTTTTTTTSTTTTTTLPPLSDEDIATASLFKAVDLRNITDVVMTQIDAGPDTDFQHGVAFDRSFAEQVPACTPYLDAAFESPDRPAVTDARFFKAPDLEGSMEPQYVVVFPDEAAAKAMFDATADPGFLTGCAYGYLDVMLPTFDQHFIWFPFWKGDDFSTELDLAGDQSWYRTYHYDYTDPYTPGIRMYSATVRVGRVLTVITVEGETDGDTQAVTDDEFEAIVARFVEQAEAAQNGLISV